jgi:hypothetical protein
MEKRTGSSTGAARKKSKRDPRPDMRKWETGEDLFPSVNIKSEISSDDETEKPKKKNSRRGNKAKKRDVEVDFSQPIFDSVEIKDEKDYRKGDTIISEYSEFGRMDKFSHRPLSDWINQYAGSANGKSSTYLAEEIITDMKTQITEKKDVSNMSMSDFLEKDNDPYNQTHGLHPMDYKMFDALGLEDAFVDKLSMMKEGRKFFKKKKPSTFKIPAQEDLDPKYCAHYFREPRGREFGERHCRNKAKCIFMLLPISYPDQAGKLSSSPEDAFICRELLLPSEEIKLAETGKLPDNVQLCLGCNRLETTSAWYHYNKIGKEPLKCLHNHTYKTTDMPHLEDGSCYNSEHCIYPSTVEGKHNGIFGMFVKFSANNFVFGKVTVVVNAKTGETAQLKCVVETNLNFQ